MRAAAAPGQPVGTLPDGTAFFAPPGQLIRDGDERVVCHLSGRHMKMLGGTHLRVAHGWTLDAYREKFELHQHVPTCSLELSERYRAGAGARIGHDGFAEPPPDALRPARGAPEWRSLVRLRPDLIAELHPTQNGDLDVGALAVASRRSVWWPCSTCRHA